MNLLRWLIIHPDSTAFWLMRVSSVADDMVHGQYFVPGSVNLKNARFRLAWVKHDTGLFILHAPRKQEKATKWTGAVALDADFVVAAGLTLQKGGRLTAASVSKLDGYTAAMLQANVNDAY